MKKIFSVALAVVLAMALAVSAFAAYDPAVNFGLYSGGWGHQASVSVDKAGTYTLSTTTIDSSDWVIVKNVAGETAATAIPAGTVIRTTELKLNGEVMTFDGGNTYFDYTVGANGEVEMIYYLSPNFGGSDHFDNRPATITSIEVTFVVDPDAAEAPAEEAPAEEAPAEEANGETVIASVEMTASGNVTLLDGVDYTNPDLYLNLYYDIVNTDNIGWGPGALCDKNWTTIIGDIVVEEDGVYTVALTALADAFAAAGANPADGIILNWWADYAVPTKLELVTTGEVPEAPAEPEVEVEEPEVETEEPAETGLALAVIPAIVAMAAVVISKKR